ncbi:alpha/beta hydrolase domain-containing protein [Vibrio sp. CAU 1672]|uniref:alpha/beta hydrolase domain-containing protein n=1 Tax=Vibrio sp. CAU 1672 TaxID=3032594 RepID=UPI0023D9A04C|nr:alpha/beta hydrolase domain-containing protein [Vibrio sp. CAU 1672]MDF2155123.1 alpha/beta hydrolase domain-containing protein [Vibrio sp. CAU 1672]
MQVPAITKFIIILSVLFALPAYANPVLSNVDIEPVSLAGKPYYRINADFLSDFKRSDRSRGEFSVPFSALVPQGSCNNTVIVDVVNSVLFEFPVTPLGHITLNLAQQFLGETFIAGRGGDDGFIYVAAQWNKSVTDVLANGQIERSTDGYHVFDQLSQALRKGLLYKYLPSASRCKVDLLLAFGWSQTGKLLAGILTDDLNGKPSQPMFDGLFLGVAGGICRALRDGEFPWSYHYCTEPPQHHVPTVAFNTQSEVELALGEGALRQPSGILAIYDYAGLAHIDAQFLPFAAIFSGFEFRQNPVSVIPAVRASFWNLYLQVKYGVPAAESQLMDAVPVATEPVVFLDSRFDPSLKSWSGGKVYTADQDGDGVAEGGVRLPHIPTRVNDQVSIGAPLGTYGGIDFNYAGGGGIFFANGGTFEPYSPEQLAELYPTKEDYLFKVTSSVLYSVLQGYLLMEDGLQMIEQADAKEMPHWVE